MIATSGEKLLELYPNKNPDGLLAKMLKELLISKTAWCSDRSKMTWKAKVSKCKVLLFQLAVSVRGIKEKEFGYLATPNTMDYLPPRSKEGTLKLMRGHRKGRTKPCNLREQVDLETMAMYPTPNATNINTPQSERVERTKSGGFILRKKNKPHMTYGARLQDAMEFLEPKRGGKLNPQFVEFLMGYPMNWTKIEPTELNHLETQSFHKSQERLDKQFLKQKQIIKKD
jgi:hypothetical protein